MSPWRRRTTNNKVKIELVNKSTKDCWLSQYKPGIVWLYDFPLVFYEDLARILQRGGMYWGWISHPFGQISSKDSMPSKRFQGKAPCFRREILMKSSMRSRRFQQKAPCFRREISMKSSMLSKRFQRKAPFFTYKNLQIWHFCRVNLHMRVLSESFEVFWYFPKGCHPVFYIFKFSFARLILSSLLPQPDPNFTGN